MGDTEDRAALDRQIEALRRRLHQVAGPGYDPQRLQAAGEVAGELDRLVVAQMRAEMAGSTARRPRKTRGRRLGEI